MHAEERQECAQRHSVRAGRLSGSFRLKAHRTVQTSLEVESKRTPQDFGW